MYLGCLRQQNLYLGLDEEQFLGLCHYVLRYPREFHRVLQPRLFLRLSPPLVNLQVELVHLHSSPQFVSLPSVSKVLAPFLLLALHLECLLVLQKKSDRQEALPFETRAKQESPKVEVLTVPLPVKPDFVQCPTVFDQLLESLQLQVEQTLGGLGIACSP